MDTNIEEVLDFFLAQISDSEDPYVAIMQLAGELRQPITSRFELAYQDLKAQPIDIDSLSPEQRVAVVLLFTLVPRALFPEQEQSYVDLAQAKKVALADDIQDKLTPLQNLALYLPLMLTETLADLQSALTYYQTMESSALVQAWIGHVSGLITVIEVYGRLPQRNLALNRWSTIEELDYLDGFTDHYKGYC